MGAWRGGCSLYTLIVGLYDQKLPRPLVLVVYVRDRSLCVCTNKKKTNKQTKKQKILESVWLGGYSLHTHTAGLFDENHHGHSAGSA